MTLDQFRVELLAKHDRTIFDCGVDPLNLYFRKHVGQDMRRNLTVCYVAVHKPSDQVAAYNTLSAGGVQLDELPEDISRRLPRYPDVPVVRMGRLAIDQLYQGYKLGGALLFDAIKKTVSSGIGAYALLVDAMNDNAVSFYKHHGFISLDSAPNTLFLSLSADVKRLIAGK